MNKFWLYYPEILFINNNYLDFFPKNHMSDEEKLNSITRFAIYYLILIILFSENKKMIIFPIIIILSTIFIFNYGIKSKYNKERLSKIKKKIKKSKCRLPTKENPFMNFTYGEHIRAMNDPKYLNLKACKNKNKKNKINKLIKKSFSSEIIKKKKNIFNFPRHSNLTVDTSMRNFYTLPNTGIINDQKGFALYLYKNGAPCKQNRKCI